MGEKNKKTSGDHPLPFDPEPRPSSEEANPGNGRFLGPLHQRMDDGFLQYASYVIRDRAIPKLTDGLKPVQRRILWSLRQNDDGKFIKVANIVGHCMQYHPHGDASIGEALVVLTNKRYLIEGQGNYGNLLTGDPPAAPRYIECRLTELARTQLFHDELTPFVPSYDGRKKEPVTLPSKLPLLLMLGTEGIAVGMSSKILPHNFPELLQAQVAILEGKPFETLPDFPNGGLMDARNYQDGKGSIRVRARIQVKDASTLVITEIPPTCTTESLIASIEDAAKKGKLKVRSINDFTSGRVEIEIKSPAGIEAGKLIAPLYAFTACEASLSSRIVVIKENRPVEMSVSEVLHANTSQLVDTLRRALELREHTLQEDLFFKTLVQIFVENRIYKRIERCPSNEAIYRAIYAGFKPFRAQYYRDIQDEDVALLLGVRIRRISLFDIRQHEQEMQRVKNELEETRHHLKSVRRYAIRHLKRLLKTYGAAFSRRTEQTQFDAVAAKEVAFKSFKVAYDRKKGYLGHKVHADEFPLACSKFDKLLLVFKDGRYKAIELPEKVFVGPDLVFCAPPERDRVFTMAYQNKGVTYLKRFTFGGTILNKDYHCTQPKSKILFFEASTPKTLFIKYRPAPKQRISQQTVDPSELAVKSAKARGHQISIKEVASVRSQPPRNWDKEAPTSQVKLG